MSVTNKLIFDPVLKNYILEVFDKDTDSEGYIVEKSTHMRVLSIDAEEVDKRNFAGIKRGSEIFIKSDLPSLIRLCDDLTE